MANNFLQFSEELLIGNDLAKRWAAKFLTGPYDRDDLPEADDERELWHRQWDLDHAITNEMDRDCYPEFEFEFRCDKNEAGKRTGPWKLWISAPESGNVEQVVQFVQAFFRRFQRTQQVFTLTWAVWCDKMRISEFSGGGVFVTMRDAHWASPESMFEKMRKNIMLKEQRKCRTEPKAKSKKRSKK